MTRPTKEPKGNPPDSYINKHGHMLVVTKDWYHGLWDIHYWGGSRWMGPWRTRREARERLAELALDEREAGYVHGVPEAKR